MPAGSSAAGQLQVASANPHVCSPAAWRPSGAPTAARSTRPAPALCCAVLRCAEWLQADKLENGEGHTSPLGIEIPGAERGREWEYYYHDR